MVDPARTASPAPRAAAWRGECARALLRAAALLLGAFLVARPVAFALTPYSVDAALAGLLAVLFGLAAWGFGAARRSLCSEPSGTIGAALAFWLGLIVLGALRSPNPGQAFHRAAEAGSYALLFLGAHALFRARGDLRRSVAMAIVSMGVAEAFVGLWQKWIELPRLRAQVRAGRELLPEALRTQQGQERFFSQEIFATFGSANSLAAFLLLTMLLQAGLWSGARRRRPAGSARFTFRDGAHALALALQGGALYFSGSKGAWVAGALGVWFLIAPHLAADARRARWVRRLTLGGLLVLVLGLGLGAAGVWGPAPFGRSMEVRFEYWRTAWRMIREQPLLGVGLGGFGDAFSFFKTPLASEAKEVHNDWLQLWAELGVLGPLAWGLFWWLILRARKAAKDISGASQTLRPSEPLGAKSLAVTLLLGGLLAFGMLFAVSGALNAQDLRNLPAALFGNGAPEGTLSGALGALLAPFLFASVFWGLGALDTPEPARAAGASVSPGAPRHEDLRWGAKAAIGTILVHQLVDFDWTAPGVMAALFLLGAVCVSAEPKEEARAPEAVPSRGGLLRGVSAWAMPMLALLLLPAAVLIPLCSGLQRQLAGAERDYLMNLSQRFAQRPTAPGTSRQLAQEMRRAQARLARHAEAALAWAPFDGAAAARLALAYARMEDSGRLSWPPGDERAGARPLAQLLDERFAEAARLRPLWAGAPFFWGDALLRRGQRALAAGEREAARRAWKKAGEAYREAARRYPLAPLYRLLEGDSLLLRGFPAEAARAYRAAWAVDRRIVDRNVRFSSVFHDPRPGCLPRHGLDGAIRARLRARLRKRPDPTASSERASEERAGLLLRDALAAEQPRGVNGGPEDPRARAAAWKRLAEAAPGDGHAALFYAAALTRAEGPDTARTKAAWGKAKALLQKARERGRPTVPEHLVNELRGRLKAGWLRKNP